MEHTEFDRALIYLALSNFIEQCNITLEDKEIHPEQKESIAYMMREADRLLDIYENSLKESPEIPRPKWDDLQTSET